MRSGATLRVRWMRKSGQLLDAGVDWISVGALASSGAAVELSFAIERE